MTLRESMERIFMDCSLSGTAHAPSVAMNADGIYTRDGLTPWSEIPE